MKTINTNKELRIECLKMAIDIALIPCEPELKIWNPTLCVKTIADELLSYIDCNEVVSGGVNRSFHPNNKKNK
jgi:hypothetical protein